jgi:hypothetical protein
MARIKNLLVGFFFGAMLTSCESGITDVIIPSYIPGMVTNYTQATPTKVNRIYTSLSDAKIAQFQIEASHKRRMFEFDIMAKQEGLEYGIIKQVQTDLVIGSQQLQESLFGEGGLVSVGGTSLLTALGAGGLAYRFGAKKQRPDDYNSAEAKAEILKARTMNDDDFKAYLESV